LGQANDTLSAANRRRTPNGDRVRDTGKYKPRSKKPKSARTSETNDLQGCHSHGHLCFAEELDCYAAQSNEHDERPSSLQRKRADYGIAGLGFGSDQGPSRVLTNVETYFSDPHGPWQ
jgi:hypothetical protein